MFKFRRPLHVLAITATVMGAMGCVEADKAGTPQLLAFDIVGPDGAPVEKDPAVPVPTVSPMVSFNALFNDLLDYSLVQDADAGVGLPGVAAVSVTSNPAIVPMVATTYTPNGHHEYALLYPKGPNITVQVSPGLPSGATVAVSLDVTKLRGKNGQALIIAPGASTSLTFTTAPFSVSGEMAEEPFAADHGFVISASNVVAAEFASKVSVSGTVDMVPVAALEFEVAAAEGSSTDFVVSPKEGTMWPAGALITVTVAADAADQFGVALAAPAVITFPVAAASAAP